MFISYASADTEALNKIDQWLRDHGLRVIRDCRYFIAGSTIEDNIVRALANSDKILAVFSKNSRHRDWRRLERVLAEQVESRLGVAVLVYLCLDDSLLPAHDPTRLAILAKGKSLKQIGDEIFNAVAGVAIAQWQYPYNENEPLGRLTKPAKNKSKVGSGRFLLNGPTRRPNSHREGDFTPIIAHSAAYGVQISSHLSPCSTSLSRSFLLGLRTVIDLTKELVCVRCVALSHSPSLSS